MSESKKFKVEIIFGAELHESEKGISHSGTASRHKKVGVSPGGRWPKTGHFISASGDINTEIVACNEQHGSLETCSQCSPAEIEKEVTENGSM